MLTNLKTVNKFNGTYISSSQLEDVQNQKDCRGIPINMVGINKLHYPITIKFPSGKEQSVIATISMAVNLDHALRGTHMSRFVEVFREHHDNITIHTLSVLLDQLKIKLAAVDAYIDIAFSYCMEKSAPVSKAISPMIYEIKLSGYDSLKGKGILIQVVVPITSLCPCSKEISNYGAHNQRGSVTVEVEFKDFMQLNLSHIDDIIEMVEKSASAPVYTILKRADERYVTMQAYENPTFIEDIVRNLAQLLGVDDRIGWFKITAENYESIHNHNAFACIDSSCLK